MARRLLGGSTPSGAESRSRRRWCPRRGSTRAGARSRSSTSPGPRSRSAGSSRSTMSRRRRARDGPFPSPGRDGPDRAASRRVRRRPGRRPGVHRPHRRTALLGLHPDGAAARRPARRPRRHHVPRAPPQFRGHPRGPPAATSARCRNGRATTASPSPSPGMAVYSRTAPTPPSTASTRCWPHRSQGHLPHRRRPSVVGRHHEARSVVN